MSPCAITPTPLTSCSASSGSNLYQWFNSAFISERTFVSPQVLETVGTTSNLDVFNPPSGVNADDFGFKLKAALKVPTSGRYHFAVFPKVGTTALKNDDAVGLKIGNVDFFLLPNNLTANTFYPSGYVYLDSSKYYYLEATFADTSSTQGFVLYYARDEVGDAPSDLAILPDSWLYNCVPHGVISPFRVTIQGFNQVSIPVYLRTKPTGQVSVIVNPGNGVSVNVCILTFDESNWNIPQYVGAVNTASGQTVTFTVTSEDDSSYNGGVDSSSTTTIVGVSSYSSNVASTYAAMCTSWGDPHFITFDGKQFDNMGFDDYYLIRTLDSQFVIQTRQGPCGSGTVACNFAVAIKFGNGVARVFLNSVTGIPTVTSNTEFNYIGSTLTITNSGRDYEFTFPGYFAVTVRLDWWNKGKIWLMNVYVKIPANSCASRGLCGTYDGNSGNDYHTLTGSTTTLSNFISEWVVPTSENLFTDFYASISTLSGVGSCSVSYGNCTFEETVPPCTSNCDVPPPPPPCTNCVCDITLTQAQEICYDTYVATGFAAKCPGVNITSLYETCVTELLGTCDPDLLGPASEALEETCCLNNPSCGICEANCNNNGDCVDGKCICDEGTSGDSCLPDNDPCSSSATPSSFATTSTITVGGAFFPGGGASVTCIYEGLATYQTTGTSQNVYSAVCPVPSELPVGTYTVNS